MSLHITKRNRGLQQLRRGHVPWSLARGTNRDTQVPPGLTTHSSVSRNVSGQSLDDARVEFRTAWEARLKRKQRNLAQVRRWIDTINRITVVILMVGVILGAIGGSVLGVFSGNLAMFLDAVLLGAMIGCGATAPLGILVQLPAWYLRGCACRTEASIKNEQP